MINENLLKLMSQRLRILLKDRLGTVALILILLFILSAIFAPLLSPFPDQGRGQSNVSQALLEPNSHHWFGTDLLGRDLLSRILFGLRTSLKVAFYVTSLACSVGVLLGAIAGFIGGIIDEFIMRITDIFLAFPALLIAIALVTALGPSLENAVLALVVSWWPWYARIVRSSAISLKSSLFIDAANVMGTNRFKIIFRHIIPNALTPVIVQVSIDVGSVILAVASFSFLGLGTQPPQADLGQIISEGRSYIIDQWWYSTIPGIVILLLVMSFNIVGDAIRDILDPKTSGKEDV